MPVTSWISASGSRRQQGCPSPRARGEGTCPARRYGEQQRHGLLPSPRMRGEGAGRRMRGKPLRQATRSSYPTTFTIVPFLRCGKSRFISRGLTAMHPAVGW
ncbi:hypothetical protein FHP24_24170 [Aliirhizobium smilacinae]|uniref:Uncharacterized protein n=1 Tax=Aliirhizobium smilacinae TaxID=1395944 RepID=A0A5C4XBN8_9HYPH|nr:hypothetical protein FHP24_24170 [Rhizobium smilacinae]